MNEEQIRIERLRLWMRTHHRAVKLDSLTNKASEGVAKGATYSSGIEPSTELHPSL